jgi:hypothetical protein
MISGDNRGKDTPRHNADKVATRLAKEFRCVTDNNYTMVVQIHLGDELNATVSCEARIKSGLRKKGGLHFTARDLQEACTDILNSCDQIFEQEPNSRQHLRAEFRTPKFGGRQNEAEISDSSLKSWPQMPTSEGETTTIGNFKVTLSTLYAQGAKNESGHRNRDKYDVVYTSQEERNPFTVPLRELQEFAAAVLTNRQFMEWSSAYKLYQPFRQHAFQLDQEDSEQTDVLIPTEQNNRTVEELVTPVREGEAKEHADLTTQNTTLSTDKSFGQIRYHLEKILQLAEGEDPATLKVVVTPVKLILAMEKLRKVNPLRDEEPIIDALVEHAVAEGNKEIQERLSKIQMATREYNDRETSARKQSAENRNAIHALTSENKSKTLDLKAIEAKITATETEVASLEAQTKKLDEKEERIRAKKAKIDRWRQQTKKYLGLEVPPVGAKVEVLKEFLRTWLQPRTSELTTPPSLGPSSTVIEHRKESSPEINNDSMHVSSENNETQHDNEPSVVDLTESPNSIFEREDSPGFVEQKELVALEDSFSQHEGETVPIPTIASRTVKITRLRPKYILERFKPYFGDGREV